MRGRVNVVSVLAGRAFECYNTYLSGRVICARARPAEAIGGEHLASAIAIGGAGRKIMKNTEKTMDKIVALCKNRGFVYPGSEIYGGLANSWDYGPLGVDVIVFGARKMYFFASFFSLVNPYCTLVCPQ